MIEEHEIDVEELAESVDALANLNRSIMVKIAGNKKYRAIHDALCCAANYMSNALLKAYVIANEEKEIIDGTDA